MRHRTTPLRIALPLLVGAIASPLRAQSAVRPPQPYAVENVRVGDTDASEARTLVLRGGRIEAILDAGDTLPPGVLRVDGEGMIALPAFIDAYSYAGVETPEPVAERDRPVDPAGSVNIDMRAANRKGIQPAFRAVDALEIDEETAEAYRKFGFGAWLAAPGGELIAGTSALATTRDAAVRDVVVDGDVFQHAAFHCSGPGYPRTLMGVMAQLRQFFLDARHQQLLEARWRSRARGARPAWDADLDAVRAVLAGSQSLVCEAATSRDIERWLRLADELGLDVAISGGRDAWRVAGLLAGRGVPVFMTLDWGKEIDDPEAEEEDEPGEEDDDEQTDEPGSDSALDEEHADDFEDEEQGSDEDEDEDPWRYEEPLGVKIERRRLWEEKRDSALRLHEASVETAFCSGDAGPKKLLERARTLVENGLPETAAIEALTIAPARLLGVDDQFGRLQPGYSATLALWTEHPMRKKARVAWLFVEGYPYEFEAEEGMAGKPAEGVDLTGTWKIVTGEGDDPATATLEMDEDGAVTGTATAPSPVTGDMIELELEGQVSVSDVKLRATIDIGGLTVEVELVGKVEGDVFSGEVTIREPDGVHVDEFEATRVPRRDSSRSSQGESHRQEVR